MKSKADRECSNVFVLMAVCAVALNIAGVYWITHFEKDFMRELIGPIIFHVAVTWVAFRMGMSGFTDVDDTRYSDTEYQYEVGRATSITSLLIGVGVPLTLYGNEWWAVMVYANGFMLVLGIMLWQFYIRIALAYFYSRTQHDAPPAVARDR